MPCPTSTSEKQSSPREKPSSPREKLASPREKPSSPREKQSSPRASRSSGQRSKNKKQPQKSPTPAPSVPLQDALPPTTNPWQRRESSDQSQRRSESLSASDPLPSEVEASTKKNRTTRSFSKAESSASTSTSSAPLPVLGKQSSESDQAAGSDAQRAHFIVIGKAREQPASSVAVSTDDDTTEPLISGDLSELWERPIGADIAVMAASACFLVHRSVVLPQSKWLKSNTPAPNADGGLVRVFAPFAEGAVAHCLRFMYTKRIDICEPNKDHPFNLIHVPRCVLAYCAATSLGTPKMVPKLLETMAQTARTLRNALENQPRDQKAILCNEAASAVVHIHDAIEIVYGEDCQDLMWPIRSAIAGILDASLFWLVTQPCFSELIMSPAWRAHAKRIEADLFEYRGLLHGQPPSVDESSHAEAIDILTGRRWSGETLTDNGLPSTTTGSMASCED